MLLYLHRYNTRGTRIGAKEIGNAKSWEAKMGGEWMVSFQRTKFERHLGKHHRGCETGNCGEDRNPKKQIHRNKGLSFLFGLLQSAESHAVCYFMATSSLQCGSLIPSS